MPPLVRTEATVLREPGGDAGPGPSPPLTWRSSPPTPRASHSGTTQAASPPRITVHNGAVLDGDGASESNDALERPLARRLGMVEEPPGAVGEHPLGGEHVEYCQVAVDRLAVARVQAESPVVARQAGPVCPWCTQGR